MPGGYERASSATPGGLITSATAVAIDSSGAIVFGGVTTAFDLPTTPGTLAPACACSLYSGSGFIAKLSPITAVQWRSLLKRAIVGSFHQVSIKHLHRFLSKFQFRRNSREVQDISLLVIAALVNSRPPCRHAYSSLQLSGRGEPYKTKRSCTVTRLLLICNHCVTVQATSQAGAAPFQSLCRGSVRSILLRQQEESDGQTSFSYHIN